MRGHTILTSPKCGTLGRSRSWAPVCSISRALPQACLRTWVLGCAAKVLQIVRIVRDEAMTRQALVQIRARVMHSIRAVGVLNVCIFFVERGSLDAALHALPCASAHVFAHAIQSALGRGMRAASSYDHSSNCAHQGPAAKRGTKTCPRFGDTILARFARRCKRRRARGMRAARGVCLRWCVLARGLCAQLI